MNYWEIGREISPTYPWLDLNVSLKRKVVPRYWATSNPEAVDEISFNRFRSVSPCLSTRSRRIKIYEKMCFYLEGEKKFLLEEK